MAISNKTIETRIKLKSDTEENWNLLSPLTSASFTPMMGEVIIYSADNEHPYSRMKIGDGVTNVTLLPFIDSGTLNGEEEFVSKYDRFANFPQPGSSKRLYIDTSTKKIYHYTNSGGYVELLNFTLSITKSTVSNIVQWSPGRYTQAKINNNTLNIANGQLPQLLYYNTDVVSDVTKGANE